MMRERIFLSFYDVYVKIKGKDLIILIDRTNSIQIQIRTENEIENETENETENGTENETENETENDGQNKIEDICFEAPQIHVSST